MTIFSAYATVAEIKSELKTPSTQTVDDDLLFRLIQQVSKRIDGLANSIRRRPVFMPYQETRYLPMRRDRINTLDNTFAVHEMLLAFTSVKVLTRENETTITGNIERYPLGEPLIRYLRDTRTDYTWYSELDGYNPPYQVEIDGVWGYHPDYDNAWENITTLAGDVSVDDTSVIVASAADISPGALLKINDEYLGVTAVSGTTVTVKRGVNGTTTAVHSTDDDVQLWRVDDRVVRLLQRQVGLMYARRGAYTTTQIDQAGVEIRYESDWLAEVRHLIVEVLNV